MKYGIAKSNPFALPACLLARRGRSTRHCLLLALSLAFMPLSVVADQQPEPNSAITANPPLTIEALIAIPDTLKDQLDRLIAPMNRDSQQVAALHKLLFDKSFYGIEYGNDYTKTAQEVLQTRSGNCLSLASLYVGAARHLGLKAHFQMVETPVQWEHADQFNIVFGHVNVLVDLPRHDATVEFIDTFSAEQSRKFQSELISDDELFARYYNNRGAERLSQGKLDEASLLFTKATQIHAELSEVWVNLGVAKKIAGHFHEAEEAYLRAYKLDRKNYSALNNLHALYIETGKIGKAADIEPKIRRYQQKNPYFLEQLSEQKLEAGNLKEARKRIAKAIRIHPSEPSFHTHLGKIYYQMGKLEASAEAFKTAIKLTSDPEFLRWRKKKFEALGRLMAQR